MDPDIDLQPGDVFCVRGKGFVAACIRGAEWLISKDGEAIYGHAGIITSEQGDTFEALWTIRADTLNRCRGQQVIIARPTSSPNSCLPTPISRVAKMLAIDAVQKQYQGRDYPLWRLPLHLIPWVAKFAATRHWLVCSEVVAFYLSMIAATGSTYTGINPDDLADMFRRWRNFDVIFEGVWE